MTEIMRFVDFFSIVVDNSFLGTIYNIHFQNTIVCNSWIIDIPFLDNNLDFETTRFRLRRALLLHVYNVTLTLVFV